MTLSAISDAVKELIISVPPLELPAVLPSVLPADFAELSILLDQHQQRYEIAVQTAAQTALNQALALIEQQTQEQIKAQVAKQVFEQLQIIFEQQRLDRHRLYGASSEQLQNQAQLFDEAEGLAGSAGVDPVRPDDHDDQIEGSDPRSATAISSSTGTGTPATKPARGKRRPLPAHLERIDVIHTIAEADRLCACGTPMVEIGREVSEQLDIVPMQLRVIRNIRLTYACPGNALSESHTDGLPLSPITAPLPAQALPKTNASSSFLAMLITAKFVDGLPLARFEQVLHRHGMAVPRQTLARWVIAVAKLLQPLHNLARDRLLDSCVIHLDETTVQVLKGTGKLPTSDNYMWVQTGGPIDQPVILYDYDPSRGSDVPMRLLDGWKGYLMTDGYAGYAQLAKADGIERLGCWAHARRGFMDVIKAQPKNKLGKRGLANEAIELIGKLYRVEREFKEATDVARYDARQLHSLPVLQTLHQWLDKHKSKVPPQSALGKAMTYLANQWSKLIRYTERGDLPIDNNRCENAIRPFVIGRRAWLFSDTTAGAHASAVIYSLVQTAKANGHEPYTWLRHVLKELPKANTVDEVDALMPWNLDVAHALIQNSN
jgi:transposase